MYLAGRPAFQALPSRKVGHWSSTNTYNYHQVQVRAYADEGAAHVGYLVRRAVYERVPDERWAESTRFVARHGRLVVDLARHPVAPTVDLTRHTHVTLQQQRDALALLGEPDESWSSDALPIIADVAGATVAAQGIVLPHSPGRAVRVVTDHEGLQRLARVVDQMHQTPPLDVECDPAGAFEDNGQPSTAYWCLRAVFAGQGWWVVRPVCSCRGEWWPVE